MMHSVTVLICVPTVIEQFRHDVTNKKLAPVHCRYFDGCRPNRPARCAEIHVYDTAREIERSSLITLPTPLTHTGYSCLRKWIVLCYNQAGWRAELDDLVVFMSGNLIHRGGFSSDLFADIAISSLRVVVNSWC
jgi:hypothetical protein